MEPDLNGSGGPVELTVVVVNPGTHPEPMHLAASLSQMGVKCIYYTSSSFSPTSLLARFLRSRPIRSQKFAKEILRRSLPENFQLVDVRRRAVFWELLATFARRLEGELGAKLTHFRSEIFTRKVSREVNSFSTSDVILVCQQTAANHIFKSSKSILKVLLYPICHHRWLRERMLAEGQANPQWKPFAQGSSLTESTAMLLDQEISLSDIVLVPSTFALNTFVDQGLDRLKVRVTLLGVDVHYASRLPNRHHLGRSNDFKLIFAGQCNQRKGIGYLVEALASLGSAGLSLTIVGEASPAIRKVIEKYGLPVKFEPTRPRAELYKLMANHDALVLPSLGEGFGLVAMESMAVGVPAILSEATFGPDLVTDGVDGWLVKSASSKELAATISKVMLLDKYELAEVGLAASKLAIAQSWTKYGAQASRLILEAHDAFRTENLAKNGR